MENIPLTVLERPILRFSSYKNRKLKAKLSRAGARAKKKRGYFLFRLFCPKKICVLSQYLVY